MTSANEALWVASSFFTQEMLQSKTYKVGQKLSSVVALCEVFSFFMRKKEKNDSDSQVIFITGWSSARTVLEFYPFVFEERVHTALYFTAISFFFIVPFVQVRGVFYFYFSW